MQVPQSDAGTATPPALKPQRGWTQADLDRGYAMLSGTRTRPAEPQRANRIPRVAAPQALHIVELFGRLNRALRRRRLNRKLDRLTCRLTSLHADMDEAAQLAMSAAALNRFSPKLQQLRQGLRAEHQRTYQAWLEVRQQLDNLQAAL